MYRKNTASQFVHFQGVDATTGGIKSGVSWTMRRCIDGTFAAGGGTVSEDGTTGWYKCALAQADTNGNNIGFNFTGTGAVPQTVNIITDGSPPDINVKNLLGTAWLTPGTAGTPDVNVKLWNGLTTVALPLIPTVAGRTFNVDASGRGLSDVDTIKTNPVVNAGTITFPTGATLASTTNITAGTIATVTTVTNQLTAAQIATGVWQDATAGDFTTASSIGKALYIANIAPGASGGHFIAGTNAATTITGSLTTTFTGNLTGSVGSVTGAVGSVTGAVGSVTGLTASNLDATVSSRLASATYVAPTTALTESYSALHAAPTEAQLLFEIRSMLQEKAVASTTLTAKKVDGVTSAMVFTLNDATSPTSITRTS